MNPIYDRAIASSLLTGNWRFENRNIAYRDSRCVEREPITSQ